VQLRDVIKRLTRELGSISKKGRHHVLTATRAKIIKPQKTRILTRLPPFLEQSTSCKISTNVCIMVFLHNVIGTKWTPHLNAQQAVIVAIVVHFLSAEDGSSNLPQQTKRL
jgi:hypothetical protein